MDRALSSRTARVNGTFYAHHNGINGGGFPENTRFTGKVESVTRASGQNAGVIDVSFVGARLSDGRKMPIQGRLISLDGKNVRVDKSNSRLVAIAGRKNPAKFIAIGAAGGLIVGQLLGKHATIGAILGGAGGYLYSQKKAKPAVGKNVNVPAGTRFGILLEQDASTPSHRSARAPSGRSIRAAR
jgi:hypothetical protein